MRPFLNRLFPEHGLRRRARRRIARGARIAGRLRAPHRHTRWAQRILAAFLRRGFGPAGQRVEMILAMAARPWSFLFQNFLSQNSLSYTWVARGSGAPIRKRSGNDRHAPSGDLIFPRIQRELVRAVQPARSVATSLFVPESRAIQGGKLFAGPIPEEMILARLRPARSFSTAAAPLAPILAQRPPLVVTVTRASLPESSLEARTLAGSVVLKHNRTEDRWLVASRATAPVLALTSSEIAVAPEKRESRAFKSHFSESESAPRLSAAHPEIPSNLTRMTDEILKQLDRRVIAARERMGRT